MPLEPTAAAVNLPTSPSESLRARQNLACTIAQANSIIPILAADIPAKRTVLRFELLWRSCWRESKVWQRPRPHSCLVSCSRCIYAAGAASTCTSQPQEVRYRMYNAEKMLRFQATMVQRVKRANPRQGLHAHPVSCCQVMLALDRRCVGDSIKSSSAGPNTPSANPVRQHSVSKPSTTLHALQEQPPPNSFLHQQQQQQP